MTPFLASSSSCECSFLIKIASNQKIFHFHWLLLAGWNCAASLRPEWREWHNRRGKGAGAGAKCRGHVGATKRALISIEPRVVVTVSNVRATDAAPVRLAGKELLLLLPLSWPWPWLSSFHWLPIWSAPAGHWHRSADPHRVCQSYFYWNFSNLRRFLYGHAQRVHLYESLSLCMCCSLWAIYCATNVQLIAGEITRILPKHIKRLRRQTCLSFCWLHDQKT